VPYPVRHSYKIVGKVLRFMRFVVLMALDTKAAILCDVALCRYPSSLWRNLLHSYPISRKREHRVPRNHVCQSTRFHIPGECNLKTLFLNCRQNLRRHIYRSCSLLFFLPSAACYRHKMATFIKLIIACIYGPFSRPLSIKRLNIMFNPQHCNLLFYRSKCGF